jgi:hypothetical protein
MADKPTRASTKAAGSKLADRMAGLAAQPAPAPARERRTAQPRRTPAARGAAAMPAEQARPPAVYSARISHTTTPEQLQALESVRSEQKAQGGGAVAVTALIRAAVALCLEDQRLRARWIKAARNEWR